MEGGEISRNEVEVFGSLPNIGANGAGVHMGNHAIFLMQGGKIFENTAIGNDCQARGAVTMWGGTFTMEGGEISDNEARSNTEAQGGGVIVGPNDDSQTIGVFIMKAGAIISGNKAIYTGSGDGYAEGGGVCAIWGGVFNMEGGTISDNEAISNAAPTAEYSAAEGGGVFVGGDSAFTMQNGTISGNEAISNAASTAEYSNAEGGGVCVGWGGVFNMQGGIISGNTALQTNAGDNLRASGGGVFSGPEASSFTKTSGVIYGADAAIPANANGVKFGGVNVTDSGAAVRAWFSFTDPDYGLIYDIFNLENTVGVNHDLDSRVGGALGGWTE
jgi:hypothetical protein